MIKIHTLFIPNNTNPLYHNNQDWSILYHIIWIDPLFITIIWIDSLSILIIKTGSPINKIIWIDPFCHNYQDWFIITMVRSNPLVMTLIRIDSLFIRIIKIDPLFKCENKQPKSTVINKVSCDNSYFYWYIYIWVWMCYKMKHEQMLIYISSFDSFLELYFFHHCIYNLFFYFFSSDFIL